MPGDGKFYVLTNQNFLWKLEKNITMFWIGNHQAQERSLTQITGVYMIYEEITHTITVICILKRESLQSVSILILFRDLFIMVMYI